MADSESLTGLICGIAGGILATPIGLLNGTYEKLKGNSFEDGFIAITEPFAEGFQELGEEHKSTIKSGVKTVASAVATAVIGAKIGS